MATRKNRRTDIPLSTENRKISISNQARPDSARNPTMARSLTMTSTRKVTDRSHSIPIRQISESDRKVTDQNYTIPSCQIWESVRNLTIWIRRNTTSARTRSIWIRPRLIWKPRGDHTGNF